VAHDQIYGCGLEEANSDGSAACPALQRLIDKNADGKEAGYAYSSLCKVDPAECGNYSIDYCDPRYQPGQDVTKNGCKCLDEWSESQIFPGQCSNEASKTNILGCGIPNTTSFAGGCDKMTDFMNKDSLYTSVCKIDPDSCPQNNSLDRDMENMDLDFCRPSNERREMTVTSTTGTNTTTVTTSTVTTSTMTKAAYEPGMDQTENGCSCLDSWPTAKLSACPDADVGQFSGCNQEIPCSAVTIRSTTWNSWCLIKDNCTTALKDSKGDPVNYDYCRYNHVPVTKTTTTATAEPEWNPFLPTAKGCKCADKWEVAAHFCPDLSKSQLAHSGCGMKPPCDGDNNRDHPIFSSWCVLEEGCATAGKDTNTGEPNTWDYCRPSPEGYSTTKTTASTTTRTKRFLKADEEKIERQKEAEAAQAALLLKATPEGCSNYILNNRSGKIEVDNVEYSVCRDGIKDRKPSRLLEYFVAKSAPSSDWATSCVRQWAEVVIELIKQCDIQAVEENSQGLNFIAVAVPCGILALFCFVTGMHLYCKKKAKTGHA
jgi:hypothetical protein